MQDLFDNASAARAAALFSRDYVPDDEEIPGIYSMTFRFPVRIASTIATMAEHAGLSRNEMANLIVSAGISAVFRETPAPILEDMHQEIQDNISNFL